MLPRSFLPSGEFGLNARPEGAVCGGARLSRSEVGAVLPDTTRSPHARLRPLAVGDVRLSDSVWEPRRRRNREATLPTQYRRCEETGRIDNFRRAAGKIGGAFQGRYYNDSDVYKWVEACAYTLAEGPDPELAQLSARVIAEIAAAQDADGYLNTHFTFERAGERWSNLRDLHELYCAGHLIQAAIADRRCTGREELLGVALRLADHVCRVFGPTGREGTCGHQQIEMALVELYRLTGEPRYLAQAQLFIERRGCTPPLIGGSAYHQDHVPFRRLDAPVGHAVRMMYYCCGAADVLAETGSEEYAHALQSIWLSMTQRRMYVTGGVGSRYEGEAFGVDWELPNERAYAESCAAIGSVMWNWRMLQIAGEACFADLMDNTLYNAVLPSLSLDGERYFYQNPLADDGRHQRRPWFECACCPPNIARLLAAWPGYCYSTSAQGLWVHLYAAGTAQARLPDGRRLAVEQETRYPWDGRIELRITEGAGEFSVFLRVPAWAVAATARVNEEEDAPISSGSYREIRRVWEPGDTVTLLLPMPVRRILCHPYVAENSGRAALARGPLLYCAEQVDLRGVDPRDVVLPARLDMSAEWQPDLLDGVTVLRGRAIARNHDNPVVGWRGRLYAEASSIERPAERTIDFQAVPYFAWANREPGAMAVWLATDSAD